MNEVEVGQFYSLAVSVDNVHGSALIRVLVFAGRGAAGRVAKRTAPVLASGSRPTRSNRTPEQRRGY